MLKNNCVYLYNNSKNLTLNKGESEEYLENISHIPFKDDSIWRSKSNKKYVMPNKNVYIAE